MDIAAADSRLSAFALAYPEAEEHFPWGDRVVKVRGKIFVFLGESDGGLYVGVKLPLSREFALVFDFAKPMAYGLGKSGWVSCKFGPGDDADLDLLERWIDESYRAVAPKKLVAVLRREATAS